MEPTKFSIDQEQFEEEINLKEILQKYLRFWPWFILGVIVLLFGAYVYLRYETPLYRSTATIIVKDDDTQSRGQFNALVDIGMISTLGTSSIENEIGIIQSRQLMIDVIRALNLNVSLFQTGQIKTSEVYPEGVFNIEILQIDDALLEETSYFNRNFIIESNGELIDLKDLEGNTAFTTKSGEIVNIGFADIVITQRLESNENQHSVVFNTIESVAARYRNRLEVNLIDRNSSIIELGLVDAVPAKAEDILNQVILEYNRQAIEDKNLIAQSTAEFIDDRLVIINEELESVESGKEEFKTENSVIDIQTESSIFINTASEYNKRKQEVQTQFELVNSLLNYIENDENTNLLPANLGISETGVNAVIGEYNSLVLARNRVLSGSTERNPTVIALNSQINQIKENVIITLKRVQDNLSISLKEVNRQTRLIGSQIASVPEKERVYRGIERQQNIKEQLFIYLLQKREENSLNLAVTAPKAKVVDTAYTYGGPISPNKRIIYLGAGIIGLLIPFISIYTRELLQTTIKNRDELEKVTKGRIPFVGELPAITKDQAELVAEENDRTQLAEACRILISNTQFLLKQQNLKDCVCLTVTSTVKGEGKTFAATNLAISLANLNKKVLLLGADLRNPQLQRYDRNLRRLEGISEYLSGQNSNLHELIIQSKIHSKLDIFPTGSIPPNPAELWRSTNANLMFTDLRKTYDYIIIDSAPTLLVADTMILQDYSDLTLFSVRAGYTHKEMLNFILDAHKDDRIKNVGLFLNDVKLSNSYGYGYGYFYGYKYGYTYDKQNRSWFKRFMNS